MNAIPSEIALPGGSSRPLTDADLAQLDRPVEILEEPEPHTELGQQVARLEQHGLHKTANAVKICGRLGEKWTYECGYSDLRKILRSHLRFCCWWCDQYLASRIYREHEIYRERLKPAMTLHLLTVRSDRRPLSKELVGKFEKALMDGVRLWLKECEGTGFKSFTHYENGHLVAKGIIALPPGASLPSKGLSIPGATSMVGRKMAPSAFEMLLRDILMPTVSERNGILRADLMAAFQGVITFVAPESSTV